MTVYDLLKFLHVAGAIAWVGSGLGLLVVSRRLIATEDYAGLEAIGRLSKSLGSWLFGPAFAVTVASGIAMVAIEPSVGFTDLWIVIAYGGIIASSVVQMTMAEKANQRFVAAVAGGGYGGPEVAAAARRVSTGNLIDVLLLFVVVWAMVAKPTL